MQLVSYFEMLGLRPAEGRFLAPSDNFTVGIDPVAVVSDAFWQQKLAGSADVLGRNINLNGAQLTIIGGRQPSSTVFGSNHRWTSGFRLMMQAAAHYQQNFSSSDADDDKPWPKQDGIRWLDVMVRRQKNLPALQGVFQQWLDRHANRVGSGIDRQLFSVRG